MTNLFTKLCNLFRIHHLPLHRDHRFLRHLALVGLAVSVAACGSSVNSASKKPPTSVSFAVSTDVLAQAVVAQHNGNFKAYSIIPNITNYSTGVGALQAVLTGRADIGAALGYPTLSYMKSHQLVILASDMRPSPGFYSLAVRGPITIPGGLAGKTFGLETGTDQIYATSTYLHAYGLGLSKVKTINFPDLYGIVAALRSAQVDAALVYPPGVTEAAAIPGVKIYPATASGVEPAFIVTTKAYLKANTPVIVRVLTALRSANTWMLANMSAASNLVASFAGAPPNSLLSSMKKENYTVSWRSSDLAAFNNIATFLIKNHVLSNRPVAAQDIALGPINQATKG